MALTCGFFNSYKGDRVYDAEQVSSIFDGILKDGIIPSYGQLFDVNTANNGMQVTVGTGRAWFNHTWTLNDSVMILNVPQSDITRPRYDTVVLEVNHEQAVRENSIKIVSGVPAVNAAKPILLNTDKVKQYPLAHILVKAGTEEIKAEDIENMVGRTPTVFATGILETAPIDDLWSQWEGEWRTWFESIKLQLSGDIVTNLQYQIDVLRDRVGKLEKLIKVETITHTEIFTTSGVWTNPTGEDLPVFVRCFGGGGGGSYLGQAGGGGGYMESGTYTIPPRTSVNYTIGTAGENGTAYGAYADHPGTNGGTTSFGTYLSANGGSAASGSNGGNGGTGGGGGPSGPGKGGDGQYGGGGGGGARGESQSGSMVGIPGANGGTGGIYGGGGGGGGASLNNYTNGSGSQKKGGSGGSSGARGGRGGSGGNGGFLMDNLSATSGSSGSNGTNTSYATDVDFKGTGSAGTGGSAASNAGGGGGGGGGYGGIGGKGGNGSSGSYSAPGAGGGGGGYGAKGGDGGNGPNNGTSAGGGGGGGYGHPGRNGEAYQGGYGGGYGPNGYGRGGICNTVDENPKSGVIIITYTTTELVVG